MFAPCPPKTQRKISAIGFCPSQPKCPPIPPNPSTLGLPRNIPPDLSTEFYIPYCSLKCLVVIYKPLNESHYHR